MPKLVGVQDSINPQKITRHTTFVHDEFLTILRDKIWWLNKKNIRQMERAPKFFLHRRESSIFRFINVSKIFQLDKCDSNFFPPRARREIKSRKILSVDFDIRQKKPVPKAALINSRPTNLVT
jgi:hypothetical protein